MGTYDLKPIIINKKNKPHEYQALKSTGSLFKTSFMETMGAVLDLMLEKKITQIPSQRAVYCCIHKGEPYPQKFREKVGKIFSDASAAIKYPQICQDRVEDLLKNMRAITSHEIRNPEKGIVGGAVKIIFELQSLGEKNCLTFCGAVHGLQEWENLALMLGTPYYLDIIKLGDQQIQEIINRAEKSVRNDIAARPKGMSIYEYIEMIFGLIDKKSSIAA